MIDIKRPKIKIEVYECIKDKSIWNLFKHHHYLTSDLNPASKCFVACWDKIPVAFNAILSFPSGTVKRAYRGHRLVVLSDYQGLGIGSRLSEFVGEILIREGRRYFTKTANIKLGDYRNKSSLWRPTTHNMQRRGKDVARLQNVYNNIVCPKLAQRLCYAHEYIGGNKDLEITDYKTFNDVEVTNIDEFF